MSIRKLSKEDTQAVYRYIAKEPEMNLFFYGDIENHGVDVAPVSVFALEKQDGSWEAILLRYFNYWLIYSQYERYDAKAVAEFLSDKTVECVSGKTALVEQLAPYYPKCRVQSDYMCRLDRVNEAALAGLPKGATLRELTPSDIDAYIDLMVTIKEFEKTYPNEPDMRKKRRESLTTNMEHGGLIVGLYEGDTLVSSASISAGNSQSAMVVGVATREGYRNKGYASLAVSELCRRCLAQGMKFLCLFYDNPQAGSVYRKIGFREIGEYAMLR